MSGEARPKIYVVEIVEVEDRIICGATTEPEKLIGKLVEELLKKGYDADVEKDKQGDYSITVRKAGTKEVKEIVYVVELETNEEKIVENVLKEIG